MKKAYLRPQMDIERMEPESLMDFDMSGNSEGTGLEPQSREGNGQMWDDEDDKHYPKQERNLHTSTTFS